MVVLSSIKTRPIPILLAVVFCRFDEHDCEFYVSKSFVAIDPFADVNATLVDWVLFGGGWIGGAACFAETYSGECNKAYSES